MWSSDIRVHNGVSFTENKHRMQALEQKSRLILQNIRLAVKIY